MRIAGWLAGITLVLGPMSLAAIGTAHLALTDIGHRESDLTTEWNVLRLCALLLIAFHVAALATAWHVVRGKSVQ